MAGTKTDILLSMAHTATEDYMQMIVLKQKNHEFRKKLYPSTVQRIWFYETAPTSSVTYICEIGPAVIRSKLDESSMLKDDGIGNKDFNDNHPDWVGYDYAYPVRSCWRLRNPITLSKLKEEYGIMGAPRGMVYVTKKMIEDVVWREQELVWTNAGDVAHQPQAQ